MDIEESVFIDRGQDLNTELEMDAENDIKIENTEDNIFNDIAQDKRPFFKSQQRGETELTFDQKKDIVRDVFHKNKSIFLSRFGEYLSHEHLKYFETCTDSDKDVIDFHLNKIYRQRDARHKIDVKNRRYHAMKKMISENCYFTETEMMKRNPLLYDQLVGRFLTEREIRERDSVAEKDDTYLNQLFNNIDRDIAQSLLEEQEMEEENDEKEERDEEINTNLDRDMKDLSLYKKPETIERVPVKRWGDLDSEEPHQKKVEPISQGTSKEKEVVLLAPERELLKQEFIGTMYNNFLDGKDKDFDYSLVDFNAEFDCIDILTADAEEKYFDSEESSNIIVNQHTDSESEDELDIFMKNLGDHVS